MRRSNASSDILRQDVIAWWCLPSRLKLTENHVVVKEVDKKIFQQ